MVLFEQLSLWQDMPAANDPIFSSRIYRRALDARYQTPKWQRTRQIALERDHYACHYCSKQLPEAIRLDVHHVLPASVRPDLFHALSNLITLCSDCHQVETSKQAQRYGWRFAGR